MAINNPQPASNPALEAVRVLAGDWEMELSNGSFIPNPSDVVKGNMLVEWTEDGAFLIMRMGDQALWLIHRDESKTDYQVSYYDARKVSRIYQMSFAGGVWKMWRSSPGFSQRYEGKISDDGDVVSGHWDKSTDGSHWEHDFDVKYIRRIK